MWDGLKVHTPYSPSVPIERHRPLNEIILKPAHPKFLGTESTSKKASPINNRLDLNAKRALECKRSKLHATRVSHDITQG